MEEQQFDKSNIQNKLWPINWGNNKVLKIFGIVSLIGFVLNIVFNLLLYFLYGAGTIFGFPPAGIYPASSEINKFFWELVLRSVFSVMSAAVIVYIILSFLRLKRLDKTDKFFLMINLIIVVLVLATDFTGGYRTKSPITESLKEETVNYQTYRNEELGISFSYPEYWGKVLEKRYSSSSTKLLNGETVSGSQIIIYFKDLAGLSIILSSPDYKEIIRSKNKEKEYFKGKEEQLVCELLPADGYDKVIVVQCEQANIGNSLAMISYVAYFASGGYGYNLSKDVKIISPDQNFPGIDIWAIAIPKTGHSFGDGRNPDISLEEFANLWKKQLEGNQLPFETSQFLLEFDSFTRSIKFIK